MTMNINHSLNQPMTAKIVKIALHLSSIKIYSITFISSLEKFSEMSYDVLPCRYRYVLIVF
jgi:hypothetical protein